MGGPKSGSGMMGTAASQARATSPQPKPKVPSTEDLLRMARDMEAQTSAQYATIGSQLQERDSAGSIMGTAASRARPAPKEPPRALTPEELMRMAKDMEAQTAAQHEMLGSQLQERDSAGGIMPEWLTRDAKKNGYGG